MNHSETAPLIPAAMAVAILVGYYAWYFPRSKTVLMRWAEKNSFEIIEAECRVFLKGPFFWYSNRGQPVYRVKVRDCSGNERQGWVRCGNFWLGLFSDEVQVIWDEK